MYMCHPNIERYCPNPPSAGENGGLTTWDYSLNSITPFGTTVKYTCDYGRRLLTMDESGHSVYYDEYSTFCQWNQTYAKDPAMVPKLSCYFGLSCAHTIF
jgi:hypothetical protein